MHGASRKWLKRVASWRDTLDAQGAVSNLRGAPCKAARLGASKVGSRRAAPASWKDARHVLKPGSRLAAHTGKTPRAPRARRPLRFQDAHNTLGNLPWRAARSRKCWKTSGEQRVLKTHRAARRVLNHDRQARCALEIGWRTVAPARAGNACARLVLGRASRRPARFERCLKTPRAF